MTTSMIDPALDAELNDLALRHEQGAASQRSALVSSPQDEERNYAVITHVATLAALLFSGGLLHVFVPAVAYLLFKDKGAFLKEHTKQQLNFQLTFVIAALAAALVSFATFGFGALVAVPLLIAYFVVDVVCSIKAALAAHRGEDYRFPLTLQLLK